MQEKDMSIRIDKSKCTGCGACTRVCPGNLLQLTEEKDGKKSSIRCSRDCWGCCSCIKECRFQALLFFLGADIGGQGAVMTFKKAGGLNEWEITLPAGEKKTIAVDPKNANQY